MKKSIKYGFILLILICVVTGCNNTDNKEKNNDNSKTEIKTNGEIYQTNIPASEEEILKNIRVELKKAESGQQVMFITNNNSFVIPELEIKVNFYRDNKVVDTTEDGHDVILPGYTVVSDFETHETYDDIKYDLKLKWSNNYRNHSDNIKIEYNINSSKTVLVTVTNNNDFEVDEIEVIAVFYNKDGKLLGTSFAKDINNVASKKTKTEELYLIEHSLIREIDSVKIYLNQAHVF